MAGPEDENYIFNRERGSPSPKDWAASWEWADMKIQIY